MLQTYFFFFAYSSVFAMRGSPTYIINVLIVTLLPGNDGLGLHLPGSPQINNLKNNLAQFYSQITALWIKCTLLENKKYKPIVFEEIHQYYSTYQSLLLLCLGWE